jgi:hypothetical protein
MRNFTNNVMIIILEGMYALSTKIDLCLNFSETLVSDPFSLFD